MAIAREESLPIIYHRVDPKLLHCLFDQLVARAVADGHSRIVAPARWRKAFTDAQVFQKAAIVAENDRRVIYDLRDTDFVWAGCFACDELELHILRDVGDVTIHWVDYSRHENMRGLSPDCCIVDHRSAGAWPEMFKCFVGPALDRSGAQAVFFAPNDVEDPFPEVTAWLKSASGDR